MVNFIRLTALVLAACLAGCSTSGSQQSTASDVAPSQVAATDSEGEAGNEIAAQAFDPIICEKITPTGTRMGYKVCKKKSDWDRIREGSRKAGEDIQRRAAHQNTTK